MGGSGARGRSISTDAKYVALARRYRPTRFEDVIGQQHVTRTLQNAIVVGRIHHAFLFTGSRGVGKTTVARILARALNAADGPNAQLDALVDAEQESRLAVDVVEIDGASHTGVDDVRELRENARYLPSQSRYKVYIIDEVHMLSTSAFNALLKTLEEPPPHVVFIFATTEPHKIPATILSRCQRFDFKRVSTTQLVTHLEQLLEQEQVSVEQAGIGLIARAAEGGVRDALSLLDQVIAFAPNEETITAVQVAEVLGVADRRVLFALSAAVLRHDVAAAVSVVQQLFEQGHDLSQFSQAFLGHLRDLVVVKTCKESDALVDATTAERDELSQQADWAPADLLEQLFERFAQAAEQVARSSFSRLLLEMAVIELCRAESALPLSDLLERLEAMEKRVLSGTPEPPPAAPTTPSGTTPGSSSGHRERKPSLKPDLQQPKRTVSAISEAPSAVEVAKPEQSITSTEESSATNPEPASDPEPPAISPEEKTSQQENLHRWRKLLERIRIPAVGIYSVGHLVRWEGQQIELAYPPNGFELQGALSAERREAFSNVCEKELGHPVQLIVRALTDEELAGPEIATQSAVAAKEQKERDLRDKLRQEAKTHPIARALVEDFGATIKSIKTEANGATR